MQRLITAMSLVPSTAACWHATVERSRALFKYHWHLWNVAAAINNRSLEFRFRECLFFFHLFGVQSPDSRHCPDPLGKPRPDLGALHAGDCGIYAAPGAVTRETDGRRRTPRHQSDCLFRSSRKGSSTPRSGADLRKEGHVELADKPTEHPGAR